MDGSHGRHGVKILNFNKDRMLTVEYVPMNFYDAIFIRFTDVEGNVHNIIVDGGEFKQRKYCYVDRIKEKLDDIFKRGESIDLWIVTHIDNDHIGGLYHFINDNDFFETNCCKLKEVWMNYGGKGDYEVHRTGTIGYHDGKELRDLLNEKHVCVKQGVLAGYTVTLFDAIITVVAPDESAMKGYIEWWNKKEFKNAVQTADGLIKGGEWDYDKKFKDFNLEQYDEDSEVKNNSSIAFVLSYHDHHLLFAADSCSSILMNGLKNTFMKKDGSMKFDLMHIPHHGSSRNTSTSFLSNIDCPKYVITGDGANRYQLPDKETIARLISANPSGCELHFTQMNSKLKEIFANDDSGKLKVIGEANFTFE